MSKESADVIRLREVNQALEEAVQERTRALMNAKRAWEATFDAIVDPLAIVSRDMRIVRTNVAHAATAGRDVREVNGRPCFDALFLRDEPCPSCPAMRTFATGDPHAGEVADPPSDRIYRMSCFPKPTELSDATEPVADRVEQVVCHYRDITDERELTRRLRQSEKMAAVGTLSGGVAHEINNPLGAILAFAQLAQREAVPGTMLVDYLSEIEDSAQRCKRIVASLLDFSRPSRGERQPVDLRQVIDQALFLCQTQYDPSRYSVSVDIADDVPHVCGDRNQLGQVLLNLTSNAFAAMESSKGGSLRVQVTAERPEWVRVAVQDTGSGIEERHLAKVFEPFFTTKPEGKGTGLGLSISYSIVTDHGGTIEVESTAGQGTRFEVSLPWPVQEEEDE